MGKKYIIELNPDCVEGEYLRIPARIAGEQQWLMTKAALTPYTEPDTNEAYQRGVEDGAKSVENWNEQEKKLRMDEAYQRGLADAWEAARKIIRMPEGDLLNLFDVYSSVCTSVQAILKYDASEAIEKIRQYEQEQEEIKVGDEVGYYGVADEHGNVCYSGVVLEIRKDDYLVMEKSGKTYQLKKKLVMSKTGRYFSEIAAVLQKMRGEQE